MLLTCSRIFALTVLPHLKASWRKYLKTPLKTLRMGAIWRLLSAVSNMTQTHGQMISILNPLTFDINQCHSLKILVEFDSILCIFLWWHHYFSLVCSYRGVKGSHCWAFVLWQCHIWNVWYDLKKWVKVKLLIWDKAHSMDNDVAY